MVAVFPLNLKVMGSYTALYIGKKRMSYFLKNGKTRASCLLNFIFSHYNFNNTN